MVAFEGAAGLLPRAWRLLPQIKPGGRKLSYGEGPFDKPQDFGLEIIHTIAAEPDYSFDMLVVWNRLSDGALFFAQDSGCSCPSPFEEYYTLDDLTPLTGLSYVEFEVLAVAYGGETAQDSGGVFIEEVLHDIQQRLAIFPGVRAVA
jgi:hypothetical protein